MCLFCEARIITPSPPSRRDVSQLCAVRAPGARQRIPRRSGASGSLSIGNSSECSPHAAEAVQEASLARLFALELVASLVILNTISPPKLSDDLILYGHHVWEALDVSEVLFLCEQHRVDVVIIVAEVEDAETIVATMQIFKQWQLI